MLADPIASNTRLGHYTNHVNLLDLCALAVPGGFLPSGLPFGVTPQAPAGHDRTLLALGDRLHHRVLNVTAGAAGLVLADTPPLIDDLQGKAPFPIAVSGVHMQGLPLNGELTGLRERTHTAPAYRLYALTDFAPSRPGMVRDPTGASIEVEVWTLSPSRVGAFLANVPAPLAIDSVQLADGSWLKGFLCEAAATRRRARHHRLRRLAGFPG